MVVDVAHFEQEVIERSYEKPVLVDFWAPWCGPCRVLGPVLEKLAAENADSWTLAKLNTDENPLIASRYGIRSIPAVKLFVDGKVKDEFLGALPEAAVRQWLARAIPSPDKRLVEAARSALASGDRAEARRLAQEVLAARPDHPDALLLLAAVTALDDVRAAEELAGRAQGADASLYPLREAVLTLAGLVKRKVDPEKLPASPARTALIEAIEALTAGDLDRALTGFVSVVRLDRRYEDEAARRACVALFTLLGEQHELTRKHRRALEMALF